jgi:putative drug exporter of the RND superfamily
MLIRVQDIHTEVQNDFQVTNQIGSNSMTQGKTNTFGKLGHLISKRKYAIIAVWLLLLAIILPVVLTATGVNSLQFGSSTDGNIESGVASDIIKAQFQNSVSNDSLIIIISTNNASSISTQRFIEELVTKINTTSSITGIENITSVYSVLIPALNQTNQGVYFAYNNANLTYNLLYSVPTIYSNVWLGAYNETKYNQLMPGLNQTNQGVYAIIDNANLTYNLLYSVPALYLNVWGPTYQQTQNISMANEIAYQQTAATLQQMDPASYAAYTSHLLKAFNTTWVMSFQDPATQTLTPQQRASLAANVTNQQYINNFLSADPTQKAFATALTQTFSLDNFLGNTQDQNNAQLKDFAVQYIANQSGSSFSFVNAAYILGKTPTTNALATLADNVIWYSNNYGMDKFIPMFNSISYNETAKILRDIDETSYNDYTQHLLKYFNTSWSTRVPTAPAQGWINQTASAAADVANTQFIDAYFSDQKDFTGAVAQTFTLQDFLDANTTDTNKKLEDLTISYVSDSSDLSEELITAIYNMGENATNSALETLASDIVWNPDAYNIGEQFETLITGFVSPSKDVTLVSITFYDSDDENLLAIRNIIAEGLAQNPADINTAQVTGSDALNYDFGKSTTSDLEIILPITIVLLVVATGLFFRSIVTPIITLGTIGVGLGVSQIFPYLVSTYINPVDYTVTTVLLTVLIGVGTDYSIFILARHREERINSLPLHEAIKKSITWAGESIVTSGATVIISFLALSATSMIMLQTMGLIVGLGIIVTLLASLTFAPALTAILGDRIFWPNSGERFQRYAKGVLEKNSRRGGYFAKSGAFSVKHGKVIILVAILVTVPAFYVYSTTVPTYDMLSSASNNLESIAASNTLTDSFGGGRLMPTYVVVTFSEPIIRNGSFNIGEMATLQSMSLAIANQGNIQEVNGPTMPFGKAVDYQTITNETDSATYSGMLSAIGADNQSALITVKFTVDPYSSEAMNNAIDLRAELHQDYDNAANVTGVYLGGTTGEILDTRTQFENQFATILPIVALGVGIVLFIVLGSLILPIFAVISVLMSIVWTLALTVIVFQSAFNFGLLFITPLILFVLLLGLGMDYNIFILTRIREEAAKGQKLNDAIIHAIQQTGGIITAAAIILAGSLGTLLLSSNMLLREMGFAFCFSILIDALVVRTYLVPAVMSTFGKWNWYNPIKRLRRLNVVNDTKATSQTEK